MNRSLHLVFRVSTISLLAALFAGCGAARRLAPAMEPLPLAALNAEAAQPALLTENHFKGDRAGSVSEEDLRRILEAPVVLDERARVGVVPVATAYELDHELPIEGVTGVLGEALEGTGLFDVVSEVSTDWPAGTSIAGLRELAARYRTEYLLLYRHRFVDRSYMNTWALAYFTVLGALFVPSHTLEAAGVLEATLFDVRTGTILYTVYTRIGGQETENIWQNDRKLRKLQERLLEDAAKQLAAEVTAKTRRLAAEPAVASAARPSS